MEDILLVLGVVALSGIVVGVVCLIRIALSSEPESVQDEMANARREIYARYDSHWRPRRADGGQ